MSGQATLFEPSMTKGAKISECGKFRYMLFRIWNPDLPKVAIIGLNPSTADATHDDRTISRCIGFVRREGFGGFYMLNLFAYRATEPKDMMQADDPIGLENNHWLGVIGEEVDKVILAWGGDGGYRNRDKQVISMFEDHEPYCFGLTKHGHPKHPLFLRSDTPLIKFHPHP